MSDDFSDAELTRYSRQIMLPEFDYAGQQALANASVLIVGLGGLGSAAAMYLAAAGVGRLLLNDFDTVDNSNLQRQIIHGEDTIGQNKAVSAAARLRQLNHGCQLEVIAEKLDKPALSQILQQVDLVLDCSDNFATRDLLNQLALEAGRSLVSAAASGFDGQLTVFFNQQSQDACYRCLFPVVEREAADNGDSCSESGVIAPLVGVLGSLQALEAIKVLSGVGEPLRNRLLLFSGLNSEQRIIRYHRDSDCAVCATIERQP